jgi:GT2 family glycosyltransferase
MQDNVAGRWLRLTWSASLADAPCRPVLRFLTDRGETDAILPAAVFGRQTWIGVAPAGTREIRISPTQQAGAFGFRLETVERLTLREVIAAAWQRKPERAALALLNILLGLTRHRDINLAIALRGHALTRYGAWRAAGERPLEPDGIDLLPAAAARRQVRTVAPPGEFGDASVPLRAVAALAEGLSDDDLIGILPHGARLSALAPLTLAGAAENHPNADALLGDHDILGSDGRCRSPRLWPGADPLLAAAGYFDGPATFWRVRHVRAATRPGGAQLSPRIQPVQRVLMTLPDAAPTHAARPAVRAVAQITRRARATVIVPTRDRLDLLRPCVESILARLAATDRLMIVDNDSREPTTAAYLEEVAGDARVVVRPHAGAFNYARVCNDAARACDGDLLLFLNNDTEVVTADWIDRMAALALRPDVGAVGAKLLFPSRAMQHGGVVIGTYGLAGHFESGLPEGATDFFDRHGAPHAVSAVTAACMMVERSKFFAINGFDDANLPVELNDIDLCLRLAELGHQTIIDPGTVLMHHESASRGRSGDDDYPNERMWFRRRWIAKLRADQHFHPALSLDTTDAKLG